MIISYHGVECVKVQFGDKVLVFNPISKDSKFGATRFGADIAFISLNHSDMNGAENVAYGERQPFVVSGPGEYEIGGVFIKGLLSKSNYGGEERINTIYTINMENINLCFLGGLGDANIPAETKEAIDGVDILFVPVGAEGVLSPADAYRFAVSLEPSIIIPMNYSPQSLKAFLKEGGGEGQGKVEKLTIKKKDLEGKEGEIVVLEEQ